MLFVRKYRVILIVAGILALAIAAFLVIRSRAQATADGQYETVAAARGSLNATVGATGTVRANQTALLTWQTNGTVETTAAKVGEQVKAGQVLASLLQTSIPQSLILAQADLVTAQRNLDNLLQSETAKMQAQQGLVEAQQAVRDAQKKLNGMSYARASQELIDNTKSKMDLARTQIATASDQYRHVKNLKDGNPLKAQAEFNLTNAQLSFNQLQAQYNWYTGRPDDLDLNAAKATLALALAKLTDAQREFVRVKDGPAVDDIAAARARVDAAQATINMSRVSAPFAGVVTEAKPKAGDQVVPGAAAFRVDDLSVLLVDVDVSEVDINSIQVGQPVVLTFDAILGKNYDATVVEVGQAGNTVQGVVNFAVTVQLSRPDSAVKSGMTAAVTILVKQLTDVLLVPNRAVRLVDGNRVVYVLKNNVPTAVKITLGASSDNDSEIIDGELKVGDLIVLNPPTVFGPPTGGGPPNGGGGGG